MESTDAALSLYDRLLEQDETKDVDIELSDGVLPAHSSILLAGSVAINGIFQHGSAALAARKTLDWKQFSSDVGRFFLRLLYTGGLDENEWKLSSDIPVCLEVVAPSFQKLQGLYDIADGYEPNGYPLWKLRTGNQWIFNALRVWVVAGQSMAMKGFDRAVGKIGSVDCGISTPDLVESWSSKSGKPDASIAVRKAPAQPPLSLLLGALAIAKQYMFEDLREVLIQATLKRMSPHTFNAILSSAIASDITTLRLFSLQFAQQKESGVKELHEAGVLQFSPEVNHELVGIWSSDVPPSKRRKL